MATLKFIDLEYKCSECGSVNDKKSIKCWRCNSEFIGIVKGGLKKSKDQVNSQQYLSLISLSAIFKHLSYFYGFIALIGILLGFYFIDKMDNIFTGLLIIICSLLIGCYSIIHSVLFSKGILLFIDIANDIRKMSKYFENK